MSRMPNPTAVAYLTRMDSFSRLGEPGAAKIEAHLARALALQRLRR